VGVFVLLRFGGFWVCVLFVVRFVRWVLSFCVIVVSGFVVFVSRLVESAP
jgi:hypothetical protein